MQRLVEIVFWFHPAIWWVSRQATKYREFVCDAASVTCRAETASYLKSLLRLTEGGAIPAGLGPAGLAFGGTESLTKQRAERLANRKWEVASPAAPSQVSLMPGLAALLLMFLLWIPVDSSASVRSVWSPWPPWSAGV